MAGADRGAVKTAMIAMITAKEGLGKDTIPNLDPLREKVEGKITKDLRDDLMKEITAEKDGSNKGKGSDKGKAPTKAEILATKKGQLKKLEEVNVELEAEEDKKGLIDISIATKRNKRRGTIKGLKADIKALVKGK